MGTAVLLRSEDCLQCAFRHDASSVKPRRKTNPNPSQNFRKKRSPTAVNSSSQDRDRSGSVVKHPGTNLVMGQVKILKRGEKLSPDNNTARKSEEGFDLVLGSTDRLGPDPETVQKQVRVPDLTDEIYAGPASVASPPPSSVPVPGFLGMNKGTATADLGRFLSLIN